MWIAWPILFCLIAIAVALLPAAEPLEQELAARSSVSWPPGLGLGLGFGLITTGAVAMGVAVFRLVS